MLGVLGEAFEGSEQGGAMGQHATTSKTQKAKDKSLSNFNSEPSPCSLSAPDELEGLSSCECAKLIFYGVGTSIPVHLHPASGSTTKVSLKPLSCHVGAASDAGDASAPVSRAR